jgi:hypothetical protein
MNSKIGILAKPVPQIWSHTAMPKQPLFKNMGDAGTAKNPFLLTGAINR